MSRKLLFMRLRTFNCLVRWSPLLLFMGFSVYIHLYINKSPYELKPIRRRFHPGRHNWTKSTIHVVMVIRGSNNLGRSETMLKSMFYFDGRLNIEEEECRRYTEYNRKCPIGNGRPMHNITVHIITDESFIPAAKAFYEKWKLKEFNLLYYASDAELEYFDRIPNRHYAGSSPMLKLTLHTILPDTVEKVIVLDTDVLFNENINELWKHFDRFKEKQSLSFAWEPRPSMCVPNIGEVIPPHGINGGVSLLHLRKLRKSDFENRWTTIMRESLERAGTLSMGEQEIFNGIIRRWPEMYYRLPSNWNIQLYFEGATSCQTTVWPILNPDEINCYVSSDVITKLVHHDVSPKPDGSFPSVIQWSKPRGYSEPLTIAEVRIRSHEVFKYFQSIDRKCFL